MLILSVADVVDEGGDSNTGDDSDDEEYDDADDVDDHLRIASRCSVAQHGHPAAALPHLWQAHVLHRLPKVAVVYRAGRAYCNHQEVKHVPEHCSQVLELLGTLRCWGSEVPFRNYFCKASCGGSPGTPPVSGAWTHCRQGFGPSSQDRAQFVCQRGAKWYKDTPL